MLNPDLLRNVRKAALETVKVVGRGAALGFGAVVGAGMAGALFRPGGGRRKDSDVKTSTSSSRRKSSKR